MSWDTVYDRLEKSSCACGKGIVIRHNYMEMNDWNQIRDGYYGEEIQCEHCSRKYHIEHDIKHFICPSWEGDGVRDTAYLIPNGMTLKHDVMPKYFSFRLDEEIVAFYAKDSLQAAVDDMTTNRYSTRLTLSDSKSIVSLYHQKYRKRSLPNIIKLLQKCICDYESYEWTYDKMKVYKLEEEQRIRDNKRIINDVISQSYELSFHEVNNDEIS